MFAKVFIMCAAFAAAHANIIAPAIYGAPIPSVGHLAIGKSLITAPAVATVSSQKAVINHVAPAAHVAVGPAPLSNHGILANRLGGHGVAVDPLAVGTGIYGAPITIGVGHQHLGHGVAVSSQKSVINHVAPAAQVAPIALASHGVYGNGIGFGHGAAVSSQKSIINHIAPAAPVAPIALSSHGVYGNGIGFGHGAAVSSQKSVINHVAPAAPVAVAAAPITLANHGIYGNGIVTSNGLLANGLVGGRRIAAAPLAIGVGAPVALGHGAAVSSQKSVINHVAPAARVAVSSTPITLANTGFLSNGLVGAHGIFGNGVIAGSPLGIVGHGVSALPLSIGSGIYGAPVAFGRGKTILYGSSHY